MTLILTSRTEARLADRANKEGIDPSELADRILNAGLDWADLPDLDDTEQIEEGIRACEEGRARPFEDFAREFDETVRSRAK